jgi:VanZ family protein
MEKIVTSRVTLSIIWIFFFGLTHWPSEKMPDTSFILYIDKVVHFCLFTVLGFLLSYRVQAGSYIKQFATVLAILAIYAAFDELTQPLVGRSTELLDWIADILGASVGFALQKYTTKKNVQFK